jgi:hypothetical protein
MMLRLDARTILQLAAEMDAPRRQRDAVYRTVSIETLGVDLLVTERSNAATEERLKSGHAVGGLSIV